ncbi:hypothetical protein R3P38DRAFT_3331742 [Favolaschia claudopus]|uniref:Uncharacterized protein n=1 Tax=Favolaschia claudopus TaxID=2862362 RepID=A0AAV9ZSD8_9AGAR
MTMNQLQKALHEKEKGKKSDRTLMFPGGKGRHLTADEVIAQKLAMEEAKQKEERRLRLRSDGKKMLACSVPGLREAGTRAKDLPKKPRRPLKPKPKPADDVSDDDDNESGSDEEE